MESDKADDRRIAQMFSLAWSLDLRPVRATAAAPVVPFVDGAVAPSTYPLAQGCNLCVPPRRAPLPQMIPL